MTSDTIIKSTTTPIDTTTTSKSVVDNATAVLVGGTPTGTPSDSMRTTSTGVNIIPASM